MSLFDHLSLIEDPRSHINQRHNLVDVLFLVFSAITSGQDGWAEIQQFGELKLGWLRQFRSFKNGIPRRHTIARIVQAIRPEALQLCLISWINEKRKVSDKPLIAIDGKALKMASKLGDKAFHSVGAFDINSGLALYQELASGKGKEIETAKSLLNMLNIDNALITLDALHAQTETLEAIISRKADYLVQVKGNQKLLSQAVQEQFSTAFDSGDELPSFSTTDTGHGREETRTTFQLPFSASEDIQKKWPSIKTVVAVERHRKVKKKTTIDTKFYISSHEIAPEFISAAVRGHWQIENGLHWVLDVVFKEDDCRIHDINSVESVLIMRRLAFNLAKMETSQKRSMKSKLHRSLLSDEYRELIIFGDVKEH